MDTETITQEKTEPGVARCAGEKPFGFFVQEREAKSTLLGPIMKLLGGPTDRAEVGRADRQAHSLEPPGTHGVLCAGEARGVWEPTAAIRDGITPTDATRRGVCHTF